MTMRQAHWHLNLVLEVAELWACHIRMAIG